MDLIWVLLGSEEPRVSKKGIEQALGIFCSTQYVSVYGIDMLEELVAILCLSDDKGAIHIPNPKPGWIGSRADGFGLKLFHEQVKLRANGRAHGCTMDLFKIFTMEEKVCIFQA